MGRFGFRSARGFPVPGEGVGIRVVGLGFPVCNRRGPASRVLACAGTSGPSGLRRGGVGSGGVLPHLDPLRGWAIVPTNTASPAISSG